MHNVKVSLHMTTTQGVHMELRPKCSYYPVWANGAMPLTVKHDLTADDSPLNPESGHDFMNIAVHVECEGKDGVRMSQAEVYSNAERPMVKRMLELGYHVPRVFRSVDRGSIPPDVRRC